MDYTRLKHRLVQVRRDGLRVGRVISVNFGTRVGLRKLRLASPSYEQGKFGWNGPAYSVAAADIRGVLFRNKLVAVNDFCKEQDHA